MAAPKGHKRYGGRQKGTPNKSTQSIMAMCERLEVNPFEVLLNYVKRDWEALGFSSAEVEKKGAGGVVYYEDTITSEMQINAAKEVCQYVYPKRKSLEHSGSLDPKLMEAAEEVASLNKEQQIELLEAELKKLKGE